jgi:hypothetical protein
VKYHFEERGMGMFVIAIINISGNGAAPTETERFVKDVFNRVNRNNNRKVNIDVDPSVERKLDSKVLTYIKKQEYKYTSNYTGRTRDEKKWDYYTLTYAALDKLRFIFENGKLSHERYCKALGIRRPTLTRHYQGIHELKIKRQEVYEEIERGLFFEEYRD